MFKTYTPDWYPIDTFIMPDHDEWLYATIAPGDTEPYVERLFWRVDSTFSFDGGWWTEDPTESEHAIYLGRSLPLDVVALAIPWEPLPYGHS